MHGIGGIVGALLIGVFAAESFGGLGLANELIGAQLWAQFVRVLFTVVYSGLLSYIILKMVSALVGGLRVSEDDEVKGLDVAQHSEQIHNMEC